MNITALNISSDAIKYLASRNGTITHGSIVPQGAVNNGSINEPDALAEQLRALFLKNGLPRRDVICSLNGLPFSYRLFTLPRLEPAAFKEALMRVTRREMPVTLEEMYLSWQVYPAPNDEWQVLVAGITRRPVDNLLAVLAKADIQPGYLDLQQLSLARLSALENAVIVELEKDYSNIVMVVSGVPAGMQVVPSLGPGADPCDDARQVADRIGKMVEFYNGSYPRQPVPETVKVLATGSLAANNDVITALCEESAYPVESLNYDAKIFSGQALHEYAANAGSLLMNTAAGNNSLSGLYHYISLKDIVRERQEARKKPKSNFMAMVLPLAIVVGIGALVPGYLQHNTASAELKQAQAQFTQTNTRYNQLLAASKTAQGASQNVTKIETQAAALAVSNQAIIDAPDYTKDIAAVLNALPAGVTYNGLTVSKSTILINGMATGPAPVTAFARSLESAGYKSADISALDLAPVTDSGITLAFSITVTK
jgi:Tfp pilus assembly protein PilN